MFRARLLQSSSQISRFLRSHSHPISCHFKFLRFASTSVSECSKFPGASTPFTETFEIQPPQSKRPVYRVLNDQGEIIRADYSERIDNSTLVKMYEAMVTVSTMDTIFYDAQRQGRISFYMQNIGEEAIQIGSAAAMAADDVIFAQYRESGVLLWRGFGLPNFANQCFSNAGDPGKGRQMPVHYGSRAIGLQTISSPLATQISQAAGAAYGLKLEGNGRACFCYFGEGAASEGDFHAGLNFATTLDCPVVFFCRNNGFAISTPSSEQYRGDGIISRAEGYGMHSVRVDGNDLLAVFEATQEARRLAVANNRPVLLEAMSYRVGHHSTSDDSTRYRTATEIAHWAEAHSPLVRLRLLLERRGLWDADKEVQLREGARRDVLAAFNAAEAQRKPPVADLFSDCYERAPAHLQEQQRQFYAHLARHAQHYGLDEFAADPLTQAALQGTLPEPGADRAL